MEFKTKSGRTMSIDMDKWQITDNPKCQIIEEIDDDYLLENISGFRFRINKSIVTDNHLDIVNGSVTFPESVYEYYIKRERDKSKKRMDEMFYENRNLIFANRNLVLTKPEYYLMRPRLLTSGAAYLGGFDYTLGGLIESFNSGNHFYFDQFSGYKKMFLIHMSGSPLSGCHASAFWSDENKEVIWFGVGQGEGLPSPFFATLKKFRAMVSGIDVRIDFQDIALENLISEIKGGINEDRTSQ